MSDAPKWMGRDVVFIEYDVEKGEEIMAAAMVASTAEPHSPARSRPSYLAIVASARYADDGQPLFTSVEQARAQPFRLYNHLQHLAKLAMLKNKPDEVAEGEDPLDAARADLPAPARAGARPNGAGAAPHDDVA